MLTITMNMLDTAYEKGVIKLVCRDLHGITCQIGDYWFCFGGHTAEEYSSVEDYIRDIPREDIILDIYTALADFEDDPYLRDEYNYYASYLAKNGVTPVSCSLSSKICKEATRIILEKQAGNNLHEVLYEAYAYEKLCSFEPAHSVRHRAMAAGILNGAALILGISKSTMKSYYNEFASEMELRELKEESE